MMKTVTYPSVTHPWCACLRPNPQAKRRLFCFPYAGGGSGIFRRWPDGLLPDVEIFSIQLPGRESRLNEPAVTRLTPLVEAIAEAIIPCLDTPFVFFGHSLGALISFELARALRREYRLLPDHLFVSGAGAPQTPNPSPPIHDQPEPRFIEELRRLNGTPREILDHDELMQLILPTLRADFAMFETYAYTPERPLDCPISAFGGLQDEEVSRERLEAWGEQTTQSFKLRVLPGDHFFVHTAQSILLPIISREIQVLAGVGTCRKSPS